MEAKKYSDPEEEAIEVRIRRYCRNSLVSLGMIMEHQEDKAANLVYEFLLQKKSLLDLQNGI